MNLGPNINVILSHVNTGDYNDVDSCTLNNERNTYEVLKRSKILAAAINNNEAEISGTESDVSTRLVTFL